MYLNKCTWIISINVGSILEILNIITTIIIGVSARTCVRPVWHSANVVLPLPLVPALPSYTTGIAWYFAIIFAGNLAMRVLLCSLRACTSWQCSTPLVLSLANWILIAPLVLRLWVSLAQRLRGGHWSICQWHNGQHCQPFVPNTGCRLCRVWAC